jgi:hypothetical protein
MGFVMMREDRGRPGRGVAIGLILSFVVVPGCLRTLDESLIGQNNDASSGGGAGVAGSGGSAGSDASAGSGGSAGSDASAGSGGSAGGGAGSGSGGSAGGGGSGGLPDGGLTAYDSKKYPVTTLAHAIDLPITITADNLDVFQVKKLDAAGTLISTPLDGTSPTTPVTAPDVNRAVALGAPVGSQNVFYVGGTSGIGQIGRYLKNPQGQPNPVVPVETGLDGSAIEQAVAIAIGTDNYAYVTARAVVANKPTVMRFQIAASGNTTETLYTTATSGESGGDVTESNGCVYWISNGAIYVIPSDGALFRKDALAVQVNDAIGLASDASNFYYTRSNGEVWQRKLSPSPGCDGSGPAEKIIAGGFQNVGDVIAYGPSTVAWSAKGDTGNGFAGGGIFTTPVGGYAVTQVAPQDDGVEQIADAGNYIAYATTTGYIRRVPKVAQ